MMSYFKMITVMLFALVFSSTNCLADAKNVSINNVDELWQGYIPGYLTKINPKDSMVLYSAQQALMVPVWASFRLQKTAWQKQITEGLSLIIDSTTSIEKLREKSHQGQIKLSPDLLDESKTGSGKRNIFPFEAKTSEVSKDDMIQFQFSYLLSYHARLLVQNGITDKQSKKYVEKTVHLLMTDMIHPYWTELPGRHWAVRYPNMKLKLQAKLSNPVPIELRARKYYRWIIDEELHFMAIASELRCLARYKKDLFTQKDIDILNDILAITQEIMSAKLEKGDGFLFDIGSVDDHPDYAHAGYSGKAYPTVKSPGKNVSWDISHSSRWPWWLASFRDAWPTNSAQYNQYDKLLDRLSIQFVLCIDSQLDNNGFPRVTNFFNGQNGWYRVGYQNRKNFGYAPFALSKTVALNGSWGTLADRNEGIKKFNKNVLRALESDKAQMKTKSPEYFSLSLLNAKLLNEVIR